MTTTGDEDTLPLPPAAAPARGGAEACLLLTVIFHPESERIGARAWRPVRDSGNCLQLGRGEPGFAGPGGGPVRGLEDRYISRQALTVRGGGDRWLLERPRGSSRCRVDGEELFAGLQVDAAALRRGLRLLLGGGVLLLLRLAPLAEAEEPAAPAVAGLLGDSGYLRALRRQVLRVARSEGDVLLSGPTGTGKELLARALHEASPRRAGPLVSVNVAAIPAELAAAQLFGTARGAFTGAERDRRGYFEQAAGGTLFLDEIGDAPASLQPQLLRALEQREVQVVGGPIREIDLRVVSATDAPIDDAGASFSRALRHRLAALEIRLRPLAAHREDIGLLARHYLALAFETAGRPVPWADGSRDPCQLIRCAELFDALLACHWPGNIRELANLCRELAVACPDDLSLPASLARRLAAPPPAGEVVEAARDAISETAFAEAWAANDYEVARVARVLNMSRGAVYRRVRELPGCRLAGDIPRDELQAALEASGGDVAAAARTLCVSHAGLRARLRVAGERVAEDA